MAWQVQQAKQHFSEVVQRAIDEGPQVVTRHGREVAVIVSMDEYRRMRERDEAHDAPDPGTDIKELLRGGPWFDDPAILERLGDLPRDVEL